MTRTLYRLYLYLMCVVMLVFAAISFGSLLNTLLLETPLRGLNVEPPLSQVVVQNSVLAATALLVALGIGGLHYWLIRRDLASDPGAGAGTVRALALNLVQAVAAVVAFVAGLILFPGIGQPIYYSFSATELAFLVTAVGVFLLVQVERSRTRPGPGAPIDMQRLHLYLVSLIVLFSSGGVVVSAIESTINVLLVRANAVPGPCASAPISVTANDPGCDIAYGLLGKWLSLLWVVVVWTVYAWLARTDRRSVLRQVTHAISFVFGAGILIFGIDRAAEWLLRAGLHVSGGLAIEYMQLYSFTAFVLFGALIAMIYARQLLADSGESALGLVGTQLMLLALAAVAFGIPFYVGVIRLGHGLVEAAVRGDQLTAPAWASALALIIAGLGHPLLAYLLRTRSTADAPIGPRSAFVLGGLAAGGLTAGISLATALYLYITAALGSPVGANWAANARYAVIVTLVGGVIAAIHFWRLRQQPALLRGLLPGGEHAAPAPTTAPASAAGDPILAILDGLLAGRLTREQAAAQIRAQTQVPLTR